MLPRVAEHMQSHGLDLPRLHIVPNGISPDEWSAPSAVLRSDVADFIRAERAAGRRDIPARATTRSWLV
jgi:hypothetical protein